MGIDDGLMKLENQVCFALYSFAREVTKLYHPLLKDMGLTYTQYITMLALWEKDNTSVKELGNRLYLDSGTLTPLLKKLEKMGLITRLRDKQDERSVVIHLTGQGRDMQEQAREIPVQLYCNTGITVEEAETLRRQLTDAMSRLHASPGESQKSRTPIEGGEPDGDL